MLQVIIGVLFAFMHYGFSEADSGGWVHFRRQAPQNDIVSIFSYQDENLLAGTSESLHVFDRTWYVDDFVDPKTRFFPLQCPSLKPCHCDFRNIPICAHVREYGRFDSGRQDLWQSWRREQMMYGISLFILIIIGWFILNRYVLPKLGIDT